MKLGVERIDYVVINHAEQDHSGSLPMILEFYPEAQVVTNAKCRDLLVALLHVPQERFKGIVDGETLSLGDRTLRFFITPWTHWPETQITFLVEDKILFPCDLFGFHAATTELFITDEAWACRSAKRYYAEIMMPFRGSIKGYVEKVRALSPTMIAPSHGPVNKIRSLSSTRTRTGYRIRSETRWSSRTFRCMAAPQRWWITSPGRSSPGGSL